MIEEKCRSGSNQYKKIKVSIPIHPYACLSAKSFEDETAKVLAAINDGNPVSLHVDRFGFLLFEKDADITDPIYSQFGNADEKGLMIMILAESLWQTLMVEKPIGMVAEEVKAKRKR